MKGSLITPLSLHPGVIHTNLLRYFDPMFLIRVLLFFRNKNIPQGASTTVYACLDPSLVQHGGAYLIDCKIDEPSALGQDKNKRLRKKMWQMSVSDIRAAIRISPKLRGI